MIDIHTHMLPNFDDGSSSLSETRELLTEASNSGVTDVICTPHYYRQGGFHEDYQGTEIAYNQLCEQCKDIPIKLHLGNEYFYYGNSIMESIDNNDFHKLANSKYILFELDFRNYMEDVVNEIYDCTISDLQPILAHPERYAYVQDNPNLVYDLCKEGCLMQVNAASILGLHGKEAMKAVFTLFEHNLVHFVASDAHNRNRRINLKAAYNVVKEKFGNDVANQVFVTNPKCVLNNQDIGIGSIKRIEKKGFLNMFKKK